MDEVEKLRQRISQLERENADLARSPSRARTIFAAALVTVGLLLAPVAAIGTWARVQLVDTDEFVATFAPLADEPAVQEFLADQVTSAINEQVDVPSLVSDVFDGVRELGLPPRADAALSLLEGPTAQGLNSLVGSVVTDVIASPTFSDVWEQTLRLTHERAVAVIQGSPDAALRLADDGTLTVQVDVVIAAVKERLDERGFGFAAAIPEVDREITILQADALALVRTVYTTAVSAGYWLPWVVLAFLIAGVSIAHRRLRMLTWTAGLFALVFALVAAGVGIGRQVFVATVAPSTMPANTANALFEQLTALMLSSVVALAVLGGLVAVGTWLAGSSRPAKAIRSTMAQGSAVLRAVGDRHGIGTGRVGAFIERWRLTILIAASALGGVLIFANRPPTVAGVTAVVVCLSIVFLVVELLRRPEPAPSTGDERT